MTLPYERITFDGKEYVIKFGFNSVSDLEETFGKGIQFIFNNENVGFRTIRALYWAGMRWREKGLTIERVGDMLEQKMDEEDIDLTELMNPVLKAIEKSKLFKAKKEGDIVEVDEGTNDPN